MPWPYYLIDLLARNQRNSRTQMVILKLFPKNKNKILFLINGSNSCNVCYVNSTYNDL